MELDVSTVTLADLLPLMRVRAHIEVSEYVWWPPREACNRTFTGRLFNVSPTSDGIQLTIRPDPGFEKLGTVYQTMLFNHPPDPNEAATSYGRWITGLRSL